MVGVEGVGGSIVGIGSKRFDLCFLRLEGCSARDRADTNIEGCGENRNYAADVGRGRKKGGCQRWGVISTYSGETPGQERR